MIYLDAKEIEYLLSVLDRQSPWWVRDKIIGKIETYCQKQIEISECKHSYKNYKEEKVEIKCSKCGCYKKDTGFEITKTVVKTV